MLTGLLSISQMRLLLVHLPCVNREKLLFLRNKPCDKQLILHLKLNQLLQPLVNCNPAIAKQPQPSDKNEHILLPTDTLTV